MLGPDGDIVHEAAGDGDPGDARLPVVDHLGPLAVDRHREAVGGRGNDWVPDAQGYADLLIQRDILCDT